MAHQWLRDNPVLGAGASPLGSRPESGAGAQAAAMQGPMASLPGAQGLAFVRAAASDDEWDAELEEESQEEDRAGDDDFVVDDDDLDEEAREDDFDPDEEEEEYGGSVSGRSRGSARGSGAAKRKRPPSAGGGRKAAARGAGRARGSSTRSFVVDDDESEEEEDFESESEEEDSEAEWAAMRGRPARPRQAAHAARQAVSQDAASSASPSSSEEEFDPSRSRVRGGRPPRPRAEPPRGATVTRVKFKLPSARPPPRPTSSRALRAGSSQVSYGESSDEDGSDADTLSMQRELERLKRTPVALLDPADVEGLEREVEVVIKHRELRPDMAGGDEKSGDPDAPSRGTADATPSASTSHHPSALAFPNWDRVEFYVKWARQSYLHCSWESMASLRGLAGLRRVQTYCRKVEDRLALRARLGADEREELDLQTAMEEELESEYSTVERVVAEREAAGRLEYLVKWRGLPYGEATFESAETLLGVGAGEAIALYQRREAGELIEHFFQQQAAGEAGGEGGEGGASSPLPPFKHRTSVDAARRQFQGRRAMTEQPRFLRGGALRPYQLDSLNWLSYSWARSTNCILADEMGLGKTVQCVSMLGWLAIEAGVAGPFLVVVPLSVVPNWIREFERWVPMLNLLVYVGNAASREVIRRYEFYSSGSGGSMRTHSSSHNNNIKFDVLLTTYEMVIKDAEVLRPIRWNYMMVDEAHRLKNESSALYRELSQWSLRSKLLVTGTPLQNNIRELWALLNFLDPTRFGGADEFVSRYDTTDPEAVAKLHSLLRPHVLRRVIKDVEKSLPPKTERILRVGMTPLQKRYYKWILTRNFAELNRGAKAQVTLTNILMDLKKCCNHPFLFDSAEENYRRTATSDEATRLVHTSGKMVLLDKLLRRLRESGHRVLIFSQFVRVLDILADYCRLRGYHIQRLDGSTPAAARHAAMEAFNAPGSRDFAFLLSTRAGGLGINLATADTVIIFDSDWNPQNDLQAMSRAHRIGQKDAVNIYRFVTSGSVEEDILERAKNKMVLDHLVIQRMDTSGKTVLQGGASKASSGSSSSSKNLFNKDEMAAILRFGAEDLFKEDEHATARRGQALLEEDLDAILARAEVIESKAGEEGGARSDQLLGAFNVATFETDESDAEFWKRLIPKEELDKQAEEERRKAVEDEPVVRAARLRSADDEAGEAKGAAMANTHQAAPAAKAKAGNQRKNELASAHAHIRRWPGPVDAGGRLIERGGAAHGNAAKNTSTTTTTTPTDQASTPVPGADFPASLSRRDAHAFIKSARLFLHPDRLPEIASECGGLLAATGREALRALWFGLRRGCREAVAAAGARAAGAEGEPVEPRLDFFGVDVKAADFEQLAVGAALLAAKVRAARADGRLALERGEVAYQTRWMRECGWGAEQDACLLLGFQRYGAGAWDKMADDPELSLERWLVNAAREREEGEQPDPLMPKGSFLDTRILSLLRQIEKHHRRTQSSSSLAAQRKEEARARKVEKARAMNKAKAGKTGQAADGGSATMDDRARELAQDATDYAEILGEPTMVFVRKLRTLSKRVSEMSPVAIGNKYRKYLLEVGNRIGAVTSDARQVDRTWHFVSVYADARRLQKDFVADYAQFKAGK